MSLLQLQRVDYGVGGPLLLDHVDLSIEPGERVCIVGRNPKALWFDDYEDRVLFDEAGLYDYSRVQDALSLAAT